MPCVCHDDVTAIVTCSGAALASSATVPYRTATAEPTGKILRSSMSNSAMARGGCQHGSLGSLGARGPRSAKPRNKAGGRAEGYFQSSVQDDTL